MLINITIPVLNEEVQLAESVGKIIEFLRKTQSFDWEIVIADNGSNDRTSEIAAELSRNCPNVHLLRLSIRGRGGALRAAWTASTADVLSYMDVDLSSDLERFPELIAPLVNGNADISVGSRLLKPELTERAWPREFISRCYNRIIHLCFNVSNSDAQCGFKALTRAAAHSLLPAIEDGAWFFDTELLILASELGYRIFDMPIRWKDDPDSRVKILSTAYEDLRGLARMRRTIQAIRRKRRRSDLLHKSAHLGGERVS